MSTITRVKKVNRTANNSPRCCDYGFGVESQQRSASVIDTFTHLGRRIEKAFPDNLHFQQKRGHLGNLYPIFNRKSASGVRTISTSVKSLKKKSKLLPENSYQQEYSERTIDSVNTSRESSVESLKVGSQRTSLNLHPNFKQINNHLLRIDQRKIEQIKALKYIY